MAKITSINHIAFAVKNLQDSLENKTGIRVFIKNKKNNKGLISFQYEDLDQLNRLIEIIKNNY